MRLPGLVFPAPPPTQVVVRSLGPSYVLQIRLDLCQHVVLDIPVVVDMDCLCSIPCGPAVRGGRSPTGSE